MIVGSTRQKSRELPNVVGTEHDVDPGGSLNNDILVLLRHAPPDRDLHVGLCIFDRFQLAQGSVQPVIRILTYCTRVEHNNIGRIVAANGHVAGFLQKSGQSLRVMHIHLAPESTHLIGARVGGRRRNRGMRRSSEMVHGL